MSQCFPSDAVSIAKVQSCLVFRACWWLWVIRYSSMRSVLLCIPDVCHRSVSGGSQGYTAVDCSVFLGCFRCLKAVTEHLGACQDESLSVFTSVSPVRGETRSHPFNSLPYQVLRAEMKAMVKEKIIMKRREKEK